MIKYLTMTIEKQKNIALIAHDGKKQDMLKWCMDNKEILQQHNLSGTGTTARMIADHVGLKIKGYNSGPLGGDQQIGAKIVEGNIDMVIFFSDPLAAQPHDPDVKALLRIVTHCITALQVCVLIILFCLDLQDYFYAGYVSIVLIAVFMVMGKIAVKRYVQ